MISAYLYEDNLIIAGNKLPINLELAKNYIFDNYKIEKTVNKIELFSFISQLGEYDFDKIINSNILNEYIQRSVDQSKKDLIKKYPSAVINEIKVDFSRRIIKLSFIRDLTINEIISIALENKDELIYDIKRYEYVFTFYFLGNKYTFHSRKDSLNIDKLIISINCKNGISVLNKLFIMEKENIIKRT